MLRRSIPAVPCIASVVNGDVVPMPTLLAEEMKRVEVAVRVEPLLA